MSAQAPSRRHGAALKSSVITGCLCVPIPLKDSATVEPLFSDGFPFPNVCFDWFRLLKGPEFKVCFVLIYKTYGGQHRVSVSLSELQVITGFSERSVIKGIKSLVDRGMVIQDIVETNGIQETFYELNLEVTL